MRIKLEKSDSLDDWYTIVRQEHDGREWMEQTGRNTYSWRMSKRISDTCVEGNSFEMLELARAIYTRESVECFRRCAVRFEGDTVHFYSPRNSQVDGICTLEEALEFANQVVREMG